MTLYIKYSNKPPFLPEAVADSKEELARMLGKTRNVIDSSFSHGRKTYAKVEIDEVKENL